MRPATPAPMMMTSYSTRLNCFPQSQNTKIDVFNQLFFTQLVSPQGVTDAPEPALEKIAQCPDGLLRSENIHVMHDAQCAEGAKAALAGPMPGVSGVRYP